jgi:SAM-dependent methyltransferase
MAIEGALFMPAKHALKWLLPRSFRRCGRQFLHQFDLLRDRISGRRIPLEPPEQMVDGIGGSWWVGANYLEHFRNVCGLKPDETVLDVGCGVGRMAVPLAGYLSPNGRYEGFDIVSASIRWCQRAITARWPHFRFQHADIFNREYNPDGCAQGCDFRFPYRDATFDFAFLTSVFTHLMPADAAHYLNELGRVLKPGGRCLATFFLLNAESNALVDAERGRFTLESREGVYRVHKRAVPETCIALDELFVEEAVGGAGLTLQRPVRYGSWCGRNPGFEFQDVVIVRKPA